MLPSGYKLLEYIQSTGSQYVDTEFKPNQDTRVVLSGYNDSTASGWVYGAWASASSNQFAGSCNKTYAVRYGTTSFALSENIPVGPVEFDHNKNAYFVNGTSGTLTQQTFTSAYSIYLFAINAAGTVSSGKFTGKIYSCRIYDNGTLVRDFVPCIDPDDEIGLYDQVGATFYGNAGTGAFIAGPVVVDGLPTPDNLTVNTADGQISLAWDPVTGALFYTVLRDGFQIGNTTETTYTTPMVPFANSVYGVTAVNDEFESPPAEVLAQYIPADYLLITDRTSADAQRVKYLRETGWAAMTEAERTEFLSHLKGAYNASDLNRVEYAAQQLANTLNSLPDEFRSYAAGKGVAWDDLFDVPYTPPSIETKYDWTARDIPTTSDMERYLGNVTHLRSLLDYATAALPVSMDKLTADGANAIEAALEGLFAAILALQEDRKLLIDNTAAAWFYSGEIYGGEV